MYSSAEIKDLVHSDGIDLVGIARAEDLVLAEPAQPATRLMPGARSVIVMAVAHSLGAVYAPDIMLWTRNKMQTSRLLDQTAEKIARILERQGALSLPVSADKPVAIFKRDPQTGKKFPHTRVLGHLSLKHAAVSCGMGQIGKSNLLLTPEFGPHQRLGAVITAAEFAPDPARRLDLCIPGCRKCENACPVRALADGKYNVDPCFEYWSYGFKRLRPGRLRDWPGYLRMLLEHGRRRDLVIESGQTFITDVDCCIECMRACPVGERWKGLRPKNMAAQKTPGTG